MDLPPSGIQLLETPDLKTRIIPSSLRPDGTTRPARRVRAGYVPQEDVPRYVSPRMATTTTTTSTPSNTGTTTTTTSNQENKSKAAKKNAKRAQKRLEARLTADLPNTTPTNTSTLKEQDLETEFNKLRLA